MIANDYDISPLVNDSFLNAMTPPFHPTALIVKGESMRWNFDSGWSVVVTWSERCMAKTELGVPVSFQVVVLYENEPMKVLPTVRDYIKGYVSQRQLALILSSAANAFPGTVGEVFIKEDLQNLDEIC